MTQDDPLRSADSLDDIDADARPAVAIHSSGSASQTTSGDAGKHPVDEESLDDLNQETEPGDDEFEEDLEPSHLRSTLRNMSACIVSMIVHLLVLIVLCLIAAPAPVKLQIREIVAQVFEDREEVLQELELDPELQPAEQPTESISSTPQIGMTGGLTGAGPSAEIAMDKKVVESFTATSINIGSPLTSMPSTKRLLHDVPDGTLGDPRAIVDDYADAFDYITREILHALEKSDVLVMWVFDQSESMKDDQKEIRDRIEKVYAELGLAGARDNSDHLLTAVTSYGKGHAVHTRKPTSDMTEIRQAINAVPIDPSGEEMMCEAVSRALAHHREYARRYQLMMVMVTDESGNRPNNLAYLERAIAEARSTRCRVYALSRESIFGYPYGFIRWRHPDTHRIHWLRIDRGPETGFVEQLQTNGFRRRHDAFPSGFAPYELGRLTRQTGGVFFMLPSLESNLVRGEKRRYELDQMKAYGPDLRSRQEVFADRDRFPLRTFLWKVISDLNPYNEKSARVVEVQMTFNRNIVQFTRQARTNQQKAIVFIKYLAEAQKVLEDAAYHREQEADPRWQANYDLIYAQLVAYQARLYEYGVALEDFINNPKTAPETIKRGNVILNDLHWDIRTVGKTRTEESKPFIEKSKVLFQKVIDLHPGTPWAARAQWELKRGFGVDLRPDYHPPYRKVSNPRPVPNL